MVDGEWDWMNGKARGVRREDCNRPSSSLNEVGGGISHFGTGAAGWTKKGALLEMICPHKDAGRNCRDCIPKALACPIPRLCSYLNS